MKKNEHDDSKKVLVGLLIGGIVGAGALYCIHAAQHRKTPVVKKIGRTISEIGEMLENSEMGSDGVFESIEKKLPNGANILSNMVDWVDTGMTLWKKFKRG